MILIWGTKPTDRKLGYVAEKCPNCGELSKIEVHRVGVTGHLFWVPVGQGQFLKSYGVCCLCASKVALELTDYVSFCKSQDGEVKEIIRSTNPKLESSSNELMSKFERFSSVRAPFLKYGQYLNENAYNETNFDKTSGLAFLATFAIPIGIGYLLPYIITSPTLEIAVIKYLFGLFGIGFVFSLFVFFRHSHRVIKARTLPKIAEELAPLKPQRSEIEEVLEKLKSNGHRINKYISAKSIMNALTNLAT